MIRKGIMAMVLVMVLACSTMAFAGDDPGYTLDTKDKVMKILNDFWLEEKGNRVTSNNMVSLMNNVSKAFSQGIIRPKLVEPEAEE